MTSIMQAEDQEGYDIAPDEDRGGRYLGSVYGYDNDIAEDGVLYRPPLSHSVSAPGRVSNIRENVGLRGNVIGLPNVHVHPVYEILDESTSIIPSSGYSSDATLDDMARGGLPVFQEAVRLKTFENNWPFATAPKSVDPRDLAKEGFVYIGPGDRVQCVFCKQILKEWEEGDTPTGEHRRHSPKCLMVLGNAVKNVPISQDTASTALKAKFADMSLRSGPYQVMEDSDHNNVAQPASMEQQSQASSTNYRTSVGEDGNQDSFLCKKCHSSDRNSVFIPCGHLIYCHQCSTGIHTCPICQRCIESAVEIQIS